MTISKISQKFNKEFGGEGRGERGEGRGERGEGRGERGEGRGERGEGRGERGEGRGERGEELLGVVPLFVNTSQLHELQAPQNFATVQSS